MSDDLNGMDLTDQHLKEIDEMYQDITLRQRLKILFEGIKSPRDSKEYKAAIIELQRLSAPAAAIIIPVVAVLVLIVMSATTASNEREIQVEMMEAEEFKDLDKIEEPPPEEPPPEVDIDVPIETPNVNIDSPVAENKPMSPKPAEFDAAMITKSPMVLKNVFGATRNTGVRGSLLGRMGGSGATEAAVMRALRWLKKNQHSDGSWGGQRTAMCGLAILTYLAHGEKPGDSEEFGDTVQKAIQFLLTNQEGNGRFKHMDSNQYAHPIASYALCEAYGMTAHPDVKYAAEKAVLEIIKGQHPTGGWTYKLNPGPESNGKYRDDTSYMGWCAQALKAAKLANLHPEGLEKAIKLAIKGFKKNAHPNGGFGYTGPTQGDGLTSVGTLCMLLLGAGNDKDVRNGQKVIDSWTPSFSSQEALKALGGGTDEAAKKRALANKAFPEVERKFYMGSHNGSAQYYFYYATQCKFHEGGSHWTKWNNAMKGPYVQTQIVEKDKYEFKGKKYEIGHWVNVDQYSDRPVMDTCLAALQLMVYYRYLPTTSKEAVQVDEEIVSASDDAKGGEITIEVGDL